MHIGIKFPTREIGTDHAVIRDWARLAGELGFHHISASDHVLGVDPLTHRDWARHWSPDPSSIPPYTLEDEFHEPLVLLAFLAAVSQVEELVTSVLVLPQRQTAVVAKQAAEVDILSGGRLRLGVAGGWNAAEYAALGQDFSVRAARIEEQVAVLRELWTRPSVEYEGRFDRLVGVGLAPLPVQRPIPLWIGGFARPVLERAGRIGDGYVAGVDVEQARRSIEVVRQALASAGRDATSFGFEGRLRLRSEGGLEGIGAPMETWRSLGATQLTIDTMDLGAKGAEHLALLEAVADRLDLTRAGARVGAT